MCTRFVYRGDNIITGFNFDIDIVEWNHKVINTKDCFYIGIMRPDGMRHSYCIFRKNRALAPHERSAVPLGTDHCPVG